MLNCHIDEMKPCRGCIPSVCKPHPHDRDQSGFWRAVAPAPSTGVFRDKCQSDRVKVRFDPIWSRLSGANILLAFVNVLCLVHPVRIFVAALVTEFTAEKDIFGPDLRFRISNFTCSRKKRMQNY